MRISGKGQVTIPQAIREQAGFMPGTEVLFDLVGTEVHLRKAGTPASRPARGKKLIQALRANGAYPMSTDEIITLMRGQSAEEEMGADAADPRPVPLSNILPEAATFDAMTPRSAHVTEGGATFSAREGARRRIR